MITTYKNGKIVLKSDGVVLTAGDSKWRHGRNSPEIHIWDEKNRYGAVFYEGALLGSEPTDEKKLEVLNLVLQRYLRYRGTRTSWTLKDAWFKKWDRKRNAASVSVR